MTARRRLLSAVLAGAVLAGAATARAGSDSASAAAAPKPVPGLAEAVAAGELPATADRLPDAPKVVDFSARENQRPGRHGGTIRMLMRRAKDTRQMTVYGYARLVKYNRELELVPDILADVEVEDERVFTLHLRPGHRWSDGHPFTAEDFRYWWEEVANNDELYPVGPPAVLKAGGEFPEVSFPDKHTVRYAWPVPNPDFLPALAGARPFYPYAPAHYMRQFHADHADADALAAKVEASGQRSWAALHTGKGRLYRLENPDLPTLQPWRPTTAAPARRFVFARNPYYHKIDRNGRQLPYVDRVTLGISESTLIAGKAATGDVDLQGRYLTFDDYTLLKRNESKHGYDTRLWRSAKGARHALYPNLTHNDPQYREMVRDPRFRRALSLAIDRHEINRVIYYGLALEGQNTLLPQSPLYEPAFRERYAEFDPARANRLLDEMGLERRLLDGLRTGPDGEPIDIVVETEGGGTEPTDLLQLIKDRWYDIGIRMFIKPLSRESLRRRIYAGKTQMALASGLENGLATAAMPPDELAPVHQIQYQWSDWGQYYETNGNAGSPPDMAVGKRLVELLRRWYRADSRAVRRDIWTEMLDIHARNVFTIGLIARVMQPIVVKNGLENVPREGIWNWDPGAHFGLYGLDSFWWNPADRRAGAAGGGADPAG